MKSTKYTTKAKVVETKVRRLMIWKIITIATTLGTTTTSIVMGTKEGVTSRDTTNNGDKGWQELVHGTQTNGLPIMVWN